MNKLFSLALIAAICACAQAPETAQQAATATAQVARTVNEVAINSGTPIAIADISIDGMTCEMGCGGTIKSALTQLSGVSGAAIKFNEGDTPDHAVVTYDATQVTDADMVKTIQSLNDGQYKVLAIDITKQVVKETAGDAPKAAETQKGQVNAAALPEIVLPSLLDLLSHLLRL